MIDISMQDWNDITSHLNGYVLKDIIVNGDSLIGINSQNEQITLAKRRTVYWEAADGRGYIVISQLLDAIRSEILKPNGIYEVPEKDKVIITELKKIISLMNKGYKS